jgi:hypothetical protein
MAAGNAMHHHGMECEADAARWLAARPEALVLAVFDGGGSIPESSEGLFTEVACCRPASLVFFL